MDQYEFVLFIMSLFINETFSRKWTLRCVQFLNVLANDIFPADVWITYHLLVSLESSYAEVVTISVCCGHLKVNQQEMWHTSHEHLIYIKKSVFHEDTCPLVIERFQVTHFLSEWVILGNEHTKSVCNSNGQTLKVKHLCVGTCKVR